MSVNPYAITPQEQGQAIVNEGPEFTLHPLRGIVWACFWGSPLGASAVIALNYFRLGNKSGALLSVVVGFLATLALLIIALSVPDDANIPSMVFIIPQLAAAYYAGQWFQGDEIDAHAARGGKVGSGWPGAGIGLLCLPIVLLILFALAVAHESLFGSGFDL